ncbi:hypothetical protein AB4865_07310 [Capnocytophaga sp. ARDL2]|uniref:hypothetical protein n=1 Tax=Capnocytophaga sp. ARDL2 TaxID=3238809 RepID=UPI003556A966
MLKQAEVTAVAPVENVEQSLFAFLEARDIKWAKLNYKKGRFFLYYKNRAKHFFWANGETLEALFESLKEREMKFV